MNEKQRGQLAAASRILADLAYAHRKVQDNETSSVLLGIAEVLEEVVQAKPDGHMHELLSADGKGSGVFLAVFGPRSEEAVRQAHTPGETSDEVVPFYTRGAGQPRPDNASMGVPDQPST